MPAPYDQTHFKRDHARGWRVADWPGMLLFWLVSLATVSTAFAAPKEYEVKAAFLLNFARFVEWPAGVYPDAKAPLVIGVVGDDPFGDALPRIVKGKTTQGRSIEIRYFRNDEDCGQCQVLFVSRSLEDQAEAAVKRLKGRPILTVGEKENFAQRGGMIGFALVDDTVRFDINFKVAEAAELRVSSKLLAVARTVIK